MALKGVNLREMQLTIEISINPLNGAKLKCLRPVN
jgi:hypothetical protein